jgi:hypothetical protein
VCKMLGVEDFTRSTARSPVFQDGVVSAAQGEPRSSPGLLGRGVEWFSSEDHFLKAFKARVDNFLPQV